MGAGAECLRLPCAQACVRSCWTWDRSLGRIRPVPSVPRHAKVKHGHPASLRLMLALLYDVHGNLPALEAVIEDAEGVGADRFLLGGDYAFAGAWPLETVERLRTLDGDWIRGNGERWTASPSSAPTEVGPLLDRCAEILGPETVERARRPAGDDLARRRAVLPRLADLRRAELHAGGRSRRRGAPRRPQPGPGRVRPHPPRLPAQRPRRGPAAQPRQRGHALRRRPPRRLRAPPRARRAEHRRVEYDHQASADAVRELYGEAGEVPARRIEQARFDVS